MIPVIVTGVMRISNGAEMITIIRNILAVIVGLALGAAANMLIVTYGPYLIPAPAGVDVTDAQSISASMHLYGPEHFVIPFLAHALGTLVGALTAFLIAASYRSYFAYAIGVAFLAGGIAVSFMIPAPAWFIVVDLSIAYLPMAWISILLGRRIQQRGVAASMQ